MGALTAPAARGAGEPLPVLVLTGFLGSGKTSLLNHLLGGSPGLRIAAVVNDFGEIDVDASAVAGRVDSLISLANGCLCCEVDASELSDALVALSDPEAGLGNIQGDVFLGIWDRFGEAGIRIPYPRQDVRIVETPERQ